MSIVTRPTVPGVLPFVIRLYRGDDPCSRNSGVVGGHLHIVLDDQNVNDGHVAFCLEEARKDQCRTCTHLAETLLRMSRTQRLRLANRKMAS